MQIPCVALTAKKRGTGEHHPAFIHPSERPHYATNPGTRATLHDYHPRGDAVNADSGGIQGQGGDDCGALLESRSQGFMNPVQSLRAKGCDRCENQFLNTRLTLRILDRQGACGAITGQSLLLSAKFGIEVAARQLK